MPATAGASILPGIHCCVPVGQESMVDTNTQPSKEKTTSHTISATATATGVFTVTVADTTQ